MCWIITTEGQYIILFFSSNPVKKQKFFDMKFECAPLSFSSIFGPWCSWWSLHIPWRQQMEYGNYSPELITKERFSVLGKTFFHLVLKFNDKRLGLKSWSFNKCEFLYILDGWLKLRGNLTCSVQIRSCGTRSEGWDTSALVEQIMSNAQTYDCLLLEEA